jgi:UDP-N-acetylmuramoylalanine--D-glutamate ligase
MIRIPEFADRAVAVMGLGVAGLATVRALVASGADVRAWDDSEAQQEMARAEGATIADLVEMDWTGIDTLVLSPGIPHCYPAPHPVALKAKLAGAEIVCDVDLLGRAQPRATYVGITGTNGKSTTTALVAHILEAAGRRIEVGGNLGPPVLGLEPLDEDGVYVLEMSSYQLERTFSIGFDVALLMNISEDHLDRHNGMDGYIAAKEHIFDRQDEDCTAIVCADDTYCRDVLKRLRLGSAAEIVTVTADAPEDSQIGICRGRLVDATGGAPDVVMGLDGIPTLRGRHNGQNAAAAYAVCRALGVPAAVIAHGIETFPGLPHRQELVASDGEVLYVNDSKATNQDAAARALGSYERIYWIAGGQGKAGGYEQLRPHLPRVMHAYLIGESAELIAEFLGTADVAHSLCGTLDVAVAAAHREAQNDNAPGEKTVLLSPACASWDQFASFGARGDRFRDLVKASLPDGTEARP